VIHNGLLQKFLQILKKNQILAQNLASYVVPETHKNLQPYISATSNVVSTSIVVKRGGVGNQLQDPISSLFCQCSVERLQNSVFSHHEDRL
jgi:hypothetical protein